MSTNLPPLHSPASHRRDTVKPHNLCAGTDGFFASSGAPLIYVRRSRRGHTLSAAAALSPDRTPSTARYCYSLWLAHTFMGRTVIQAERVGRGTMRKLPRRTTPCARALASSLGLRSWQVTDLHRTTQRRFGIVLVAKSDRISRERPELPNRMVRPMLPYIPFLPSWHEPFYLGLPEFSCPRRL